MTSTQEREAIEDISSPAALVSLRIGQQLGQMAGHTFLRLQQATRGFREEAEQIEQSPAPEQEQDQGQAEAMATPATEHRPALEKAETLVEQFGQRAVQFTIAGNLSLRRTFARLREDAEDIVIEAQEMQKERQKQDW